MPHSVTDRDSEGFVGRRDIMKGLERLNGLTEALKKERQVARMKQDLRKEFGELGKELRELGFMSEGDFEGDFEGDSERDSVTEED